MEINIFAVASFYWGKGLLKVININKYKLNKKILDLYYFIKIRMLAKSFVYPANNFGHQHNVRYYFYNTYVTQGNNWSSFGLHQVEVRNETDRVIEVVGWTMKDGRVEEDFRVKEVKPALFYTARVVPTNLSSARNIRGAVTFRFKGTN